MLLQLFHLPSNNKNNNKDNRLSVYVNDVNVMIIMVSSVLFVKSCSYTLDFAYNLYNMCPFLNIHFAAGCF